MSEPRRLPETRPEPSEHSGSRSAAKTMIAVGVVLIILASLLAIFAL